MPYSIRERELGSGVRAGSADRRVLADLMRPAGSHPIECLENRPINLLEPA
jgi:hypothetical protein